MKINQSNLIRCGFKFVNQKLSFEKLQLFEDKLPQGRFYKFLLNGYHLLESERYDKQLDGYVVDIVKMYKIKGRFGKHQWICCYNHHEYFELENVESLLAVCDEIYHNKKVGFVYVIKSDFGYKIGRTKNLDNRSKQFEVKLPFEWSFVKIYVLERAEDMEKMSHELLADKRLNGEWFDIDEVDFKLLNQLHQCLLNN